MTRGLTVPFVGELKDKRWNSWDAWKTCMTNSLSGIGDVRFSLNKEMATYGFDVGPREGSCFVILEIDARTSSVKITCGSPAHCEMIVASQRPKDDERILSALSSCKRLIARSQHPTDNERAWFTMAVCAIKNGQEAWRRELSEATTLRLVYGK